MGVIADTILRGWEGFLARPTGPLNLRFLIQPAIASILAVRAGLADAREGRPAFLWAAITDRPHRRALLIDALTHLRVPLLVATALDVAYQIVVNHGVYVIELTFTVFLLAIVPYVLVRGPVNRMASAFRRDVHP